MPAEAVRRLARGHMAPSIIVASAVAFVLSPGAPALAQRVDLCSARALTAPLREGLIPPVVGCDYAAIERVLGRGRYPIQRRDAPSSRPKGVIFAQEPRVGSRVRPGTRLVLFVSNGSQTTKPGAPVIPGRPERPGRPGIVDRPPPEAPAPRLAADLSVSVNPQSPSPSRAGAQTRTWIDVRNEGPSRATRIRVVGRWTNLRITGVTGACSRLPCVIAALEPGSATRIFVTGQVAGEGAYGEAVQVRAAERDPRPGNNADRYARTAPAAPSRPPPERPPADPGSTRPSDAPRPSDPPRAADTPPAPSPPSDAPAPSRPPVVSDTSTQPEPPAPRPAPTPPAAPDAPVPEDAVPEAPPPADAPRPVTPELSKAPGSEPSAGDWLDPKQPRFWLLVILAALGVAVPAAAVSMGKATAGQAAKLARLITVAPTLDRAGEASVGPIEMAGPAISVRARLEMGEAAPVGPVAVKTEQEDG